MAVATGLRLSTRQRLALTPGMRQSLALLRLPAGDLRDEISRIASDNPFVEISFSSAGGADWLPEAASPEPSLFLDLHQQLSTMRLSPEVLHAALMLVTELREDGYLDATLAEIAAETDLPEPLLAQGLAALHCCEPPGIGARDLAECLALQLVARGQPEPLARAITARLDDFAEERWHRLERDLALPHDRLMKIAALLPMLPASPVSRDDRPVVTRIPDLIVERGPDGSPRVRLNPDAIPVVRLAPRIPGASDELARAQAEAGLLLAGLRARGETLLRVGRHIAQAQARHFASDGTAALVPMTQVEAAHAIGLHPATLSRAIAAKSLIAGGRTVPLAAFFSHAVPAAGGALSAHEVQRRIRALIAAEPPEAPLADDAICAHLQSEGVDIARRTVAKYRKCMRIASSFERRRRKVTARDQPPKARAVNPAEK